MSERMMSHDAARDAVRNGRGRPAGHDSGRGLARGATLALMAGALALAACGGGSRSSRAPVEIKGTDPGAVPGVAAGPSVAATTRPAGPDPLTGVINYDGYAAAVARDGDTVQSVADRVGLSASELGAYNGLAPSHRLRPGDELVLPPRPGGYATAAADTGITVPGTATDGVTALPSAGSPITAGSITPGLTPGGVQALGTTAASEPLDGGTGTGAGATPAPNASGWSPARIADVIDRSGAATPIPDPAGAAPSAAPLPGTAAAPVPGVATPIAPAPSPAPATAAGTAAGTDVAALPDTAAPSAAPSSAGMLMRPVDGPVAIGYNRGSGPARNDGVDFAADAGSPVVAAADGEVALVSQSLGGLGTIVLIRHPGGLLTVYGRIDGVTVQKGDQVRRGQRIGSVADASPSESRMHFEVRKGAESVNPMDYL